MISNDFNTRSIWKSLVHVASCVCMAEVRKHVSMLLSPALNCSFPAQNAFVSGAKSVVSSAKCICLRCPKALSPASNVFISSIINIFILYFLEVGLQLPPG